MEGIPHHLVDVLDPEEDFHVVRFQQMAKEAMKGIYKRGHIPIVVGGTGFYIQALLYDIDFTENEGDTACRAVSYTHLDVYKRQQMEDPKLTQGLAVSYTHLPADYADCI